MTLDSLYTDVIALVAKLALTLDLCAKTIRICKDNPEALERIAHIAEDFATACRESMSRLEDSAND